MAAVREILFGMKNLAECRRSKGEGIGFGSRGCSPRLLKLISCALVILFFAAGNNRAQTMAGGRASDFTSVEYFDAPHELQMKSRLSGAEASPEAGGLLIIRQFKLEKFDENGRREIVVTAPECVYDTLNGVASSAGKLQLQTGDGKIRVEGEGFLWRQADSSLTISNDVRTVIAGAPEEKIKS